MYFITHVNRYISIKCKKKIEHFYTHTIKWMTAYLSYCIWIRIRIRFWLYHWMMSPYNLKWMFCKNEYIDPKMVSWWYHSYVCHERKGYWCVHWTDAKAERIGENWEKMSSRIKFMLEHDFIKNKEEKEKLTEKMRLVCLIRVIFVLCFIFFSSLAFTLDLSNLFIVCGKVLDGFYGLFGLDD